MSLNSERLREQRRPGREPEKEEQESPAKVQLKRELAKLSYADQAKKVEPPLPAIVQTLGGSTPDTGTVHQAAAQGLAGPAQTLPHAERIQRAFGGHSVAGIKAHVGGAAAAATRAMGATAYATGTDVAFREAPDLHTAAHEAAHVVQQRQGVSLPGGVGRSGDAYEKHADAVADRVVAGRSAADLLSTSPGAGGGTAVQREEEGGGGGAPEALPEATWEEIGGIERRLVISHEGGTPKVVQHPGFTPIEIAASTRAPFEIAGSIEALTKKYLDPTNTEDKAKLLSTIKAEMTKLRMAMVKARGLNQAPIALRDGFEKYLGGLISGGAGAFGAGKGAVDEMVLSAVNLLRVKFSDEEANATSVQQVFDQLAGHPDFEAVIKSFGIDPKTGFAGVRGASFEAVRAILLGGTLDEKIVTLHVFGGKFLAGELAARGEVYNTIAARLSPEWLTALSNNITSGKTGNKMMEFPEVCTDYKTAKAQNMDRKMPGQPIENLNLGQLTYLANKVGVDISAALAKTDESEKLQAIVATLKAAGHTTSQAGGMADATSLDPALGHLNGSVENLLKIESDFVQQANTTLKMPLKAGISGTTQRVCGLAVELGVPQVDRVRLAMIGHLNNIEAHSFHEVMVAASGYPGCTDYVPGKYVPNSPVGEEAMLEEAKKFLATQSELLKDCTGESDIALQAKVMLGILPFPTTG